MPEDPKLDQLSRENEKLKKENEKLRKELEHKITYSKGLKTQVERLQNELEDALKPKRHVTSRQL